MLGQEEISQQLQLLTINRRTLAHYLRQRDQQGYLNTPPGILNGIDEARSNIRRIKGILQSWGVSVEDLPDDEEAISRHIPAYSADTSVATLHSKQPRQWHLMVWGGALIGLVAIILSLILQIKTADPPPFIGTWRGPDPRDGSEITLTIQQSEQQLHGSLTDTYFEDLNGAKMPGSYGEGEGMARSDIEGEIIFNLKRELTPPYRLGAQLTLSHERQVLTLQNFILNDLPAEMSPIILTRQGP